MSDNFGSMEDLLIHAMGDTRINYYAYALGRSRYEPPTEATARLVMQLIFNQGPKWIELLERFAIQNYQLIFHVFRDCLMVYPTLLHVAHPFEHIAMLSELEGKIIETLENNPSDLAWCAFTELLRRRRESDRQEDRLNLLNRITNVMDRNPNFLDGISRIQDSEVGTGLSSIYQLTNYKVFLQLIKFYKSCCQVYRKSMTYLQSTSQNARPIEWIRGRYIQIFNNFAQEIKKREEGHSNFKEDLLECLCELRGFVQVEAIAITAAEALVHIVFKWSVLPNKHEDPQEQLNWEYGLIFGEYGDDLPSRVALTTNTLCNSVPNFLRKYLTFLDQNGTSSLPIGQFFMRLSVVYKIISKRRDIVDELLDPLIGKIKNGLSTYHVNCNPQDQINFCRTFRIYLLFSGVLKDSYFDMLINSTLEMLRLQKYTSFCFLEGCNIFQQISNKSNFGRRSLERISFITKQRVPLIVDGLLNIVKITYEEHPLSYQSQPRQGKLYRIYSLLEEFLKSNETVAEGLVPTILKRLCEWAAEQAGSNWTRGVSTTPVLVKLVRSCKLCITLIKDDYYCDLEGPIYNLLELLKHHQSRDFEEELLEILTFVITIEERVSPPICTVLTTLQRIAQQNKSLFCIINVVKAICRKKVADSVLYDWPDLCLYFLNLFGNYINMINSKYRDLYPAEFEEVIVSFGMFLQAYEPYLDDNQQARSSVLYILQTMNQDELQTQLFIIMDHHRSVEPYRFLTVARIPTFTRRNTFKLLHIFFCDQLLRDYSENKMQSLIDMHRIEAEKRAKMDFTSQVNADWPCLHTSIKDYMMQTLKELRKKRKIDMMEYSMYSRELDLQS